MTRTLVCRPPEITSLVVKGQNGAIARREQELTTDPNHPDYIGRAAPMFVFDPAILTAEQANALADEIWARGLQHGSREVIETC